jgi:DNA-directed RNA polymerase specialized sigma24 family protein
MSSPKHQTPFPNTRWTLLQQLREGSEADSRSALEILCQAYWTPLYAVARYERMSEHDAQDAVQGFFVSLLRRETFAKADAAQGKLRTLLLCSFKNYCTTEWRKGQSQKRGDGAEHLPLHDVGAAEDRFSKDMHSPGLSVEKLYAREWARIVLDRSLEALRKQYAELHQQERFALLQGPLMQDIDNIRLDHLAESAGLTPTALRTALRRIRSHYREHIERELSRMLGTRNPVEILEEVSELFRAFE